jgi:hypothetical protein
VLFCVIFVMFCVVFVIFCFVYVFWGRHYNCTCAVNPEFQKIPF